MCHVKSRLTSALVALGLGALLAACAPASSQQLAAGAAPVLLGAHNDTSTPFNLVSLPALIDHTYDGRGLRLTEVLTRELAFTRYAVTYRSGKLTISGVMVVPNRPGRHPLVVIAHGYADPSRYTRGSMLEREQAAFAENGFVAFQIDYRNYALSSRERSDPVAHPLGYPADLINAVQAVKAARLSFVDTSRIGLFGRSMGGGVVLNALAARPHLAKAAVLYAPVSSEAADNYDQWVARDPLLRRRVQGAYGTPQTRPAFWGEASSRTYFGRLAVPVQINHGTTDLMCPVRWSEATADALRADGKDVKLYEYRGEDHRLGKAWPLFMHRTVTFLRAQLG
jgi:dipeptidyl aminopeptidase/acylaminoacyl peptidase